MLVFNEDGRFLSQAQNALQQLRGQAEWICVAASGAAVGIALALAAQLPVERLALWMDGAYRIRNRELHRIHSFARRNLSLVISEILLIDADEAAERRLARGLGRHVRLRYAAGKDLLPGDLLERWTDG
ncbi:MAG: hypothetical protein IJ466_09860 [Clostridia bacterium]|nr:hypothetical protein [Clostridia bacterium]